MAKFVPVALVVVAFVAVTTLVYSQGAGEDPTATPIPTATPVSAMPMAFISGYVIASGSDIPPHSTLTARVHGYESEPVPIQDEGAYRGLFVDPQSTAFIGQPITFYVNGRAARTLSTYVSGSFEKDFDITVAGRLPTPEPKAETSRISTDTFELSSDYTCRNLAEQVRLFQALPEQFYKRGYVVVEYKNVVENLLEPIPDVDVIGFEEWAKRVNERIAVLTGDRLECRAIAVGSNGAETPGTLIRDGSRISFIADQPEAP